MAICIKRMVGRWREGRKWVLLHLLYEAVKWIIPVKEIRPVSWTWYLKCMPQTSRRSRGIITLSLPRSSSVLILYWRKEDSFSSVFFSSNFMLIVSFIRTLFLPLLHIVFNSNFFLILTHQRHLAETLSLGQVIKSPCHFLIGISGGVRVWSHRAKKGNPTGSSRDNTNGKKKGPFLLIDHDSVTRERVEARTVPPSHTIATKNHSGVANPK